jgi:carboxymethylenebutenolidase
VEVSIVDQKIIDLYDGLTHGFLNRRQFIDGAAGIVGSVAAAAALLPLLQCNYARAETVSSSDPRLASERISYDTPRGTSLGYLSRPAAKGKRPAIVVVHQNRGLNPHIEDVARRFAVEGFLALALDLLSPFGGTPPSEEEQVALFAKVDRNDPTVGVATASFLKSHPESTGKVGMVGFCFGGGMVDLVAMNSPELDAAVSYYGTIPADKSKVKDIRAPLLLHYASLDARVNAGIADWEAALQANNKKYSLHMYEGVNHAFNDDTAGPRYNKAAADLAWGRTIAFFKEHLGAPPNAA